MAREYWSGLGTLQGVFSYYYEDFDSQGNWVTKTGSFRVHLNGWGMYGSQALSPGGEAYWPVFWAGDPDLVASEDYFANYTQMTLMNGFSFVRFEGLPTIPRSLGSLSSGTYNDYNAAAAAAAAATSAASANYLSTLRGLEAAPLASSVRIAAENMDSSHPPGTFRLVYTPDVTSALTLGDLIQTDPYGEGNAYVTTLSPTSALFGIEDVTVILTGYDDVLTDVAGGFAARLLRIEAGDGDDTITVTGDRNGADGNSTFGSAPLNMVIHGGNGNDAITVLVIGTAIIDGGAGADTIMGQALANGPLGYFEVMGGSGDDYVLGIDEGANLLHGDDGNDTLIGGFDGADTIFGGAGADYISVGSWWDSFNRRSIYSDVASYLDGGAGNDSISGGNGNDTILGGADNDLIYGGSGGDFIGGGASNDTIRGDNGADTIYGGLGNDDLAGGAGNDLIFGAAGANIIWGGLGNDTVQGGTGSDTIYGGGDGTNQLFGNDGDDLIFAGTGGDFIGGGAGNDIVRGGNGADTIYGGLGNDDLAGGAGNDVIFGSTGNNTIWGGLGNDTLHGGTGRDVMNGGPGADVFVFASSANIGIVAARDVITGFTSGVDRIDLSALNTQFNGTAGVLGGGQASFFYFAASGLLIGDQNGNGAADWVLVLAGAPAVTAGDFLL